MKEDEFKLSLESRFAVLDILSEVNSHENWNNICIDTSFVNYKSNDKIQEVFMNLVKYNPDYSEDSLSIEIKIIYQNIESDIFSILFNRKKLTRVIVDFSEKMNWAPFKNKSVPYSDDENYFSDINKVISVILKRLKTHRELNSLCFISEKTVIELNEQNSNDLISLLGNENEVKILVLKNISLFEKTKESFVKATYNSKYLKYLHIEGLTLDISELKDFERNFTESSKVCYICFDSLHMLENLYSKEETPGEN
jgi:hypothetical protein